MQKTFLGVFLFLVLCASRYSVQAQNNQDITPHFNHSTVYVVDLEKSADFYEKVMLLQKIAEPFHDNKHVWFKMGDHSELHVIKGASAVGAHDVSMHLAFSVSSVESFMKHLDQLNIKYGNFKGDPSVVQMRPDNIKQIYFQDPEGYWIEVNNDQF